MGVPSTSPTTAVKALIGQVPKARKANATSHPRASNRFTRRIPAWSLNYELFSPHTEDMDNSNNCSIVLKLVGLGGDGFAYLITGDTENERWDTITRLFGDGLKSDVLSAPHHGSKNAAHPKMALLVSPNTVEISAGVDNQYGHPDPQAVKVYNRVAEHVFQTNIENGVSLHTKRQGDDFLTLLAR